MNGRRFSAGSGYRYGFNGKENDTEVKGDGNQQDYGFRTYDPRLSKFLSVDPLMKKYSELTPYQFSSNTPIQAVDLDGLERLDVTSYDAATRTAAIQIVKNVYLNSNNIPTQLSALGNTTFSQIFSSGNTAVYVSTMPQNGQQFQTVSKAEFNKGVGYKLNISYNTSLQYTTNPNSINLTDNANALFELGASADFTNPLTFARASVDNTNRGTFNPNYAGYNPPASWDPSSVPSYEELIAHETGFHIMGRLLHIPDAQGRAVYPTNNTLESNLPGQIRPNNTNTLGILNAALRVGNLNDPNELLPSPPPLPAPAKIPAVGLTRPAPLERPSPITLQTRNTPNITQPNN